MHLPVYDSLSSTAKALRSPPLLSQPSHPPLCALSPSFSSSYARTHSAYVAVCASQVRRNNSQWEASLHRSEPMGWRGRPLEKRAVEHTVNILPVRKGGVGGVHGRGSHGPTTPLS